MEIRRTWKLTRSRKSLRHLLAKNNFQGEVPVANQCVKVRGALRELGKAMVRATLEVKMHFLCCNLIPAVYRIPYIRVEISVTDMELTKSSPEAGSALGA